MNPEQEFLPDVDEWKRENDLGNLERKEIAECIADFPRSLRPMVQKYLDHVPLSREEEAEFHKARIAWWAIRHGFPYSARAEREQYLRNVYGGPEALSQTAKLEEELLDAAARGDEEGLQTLHKRYQERFPDQREGVEALFGYFAFRREHNLFRTISEGLNAIRSEQDYHDAFEKSREKIQELLQSITEYRFLVTHFVDENTESKDFLQRFWQVIEDVGMRDGEDALREAQLFRRSTLSQVAVMKLFKGIGETPTLSHPAEDAFKAIDLWVFVGGKRHPVQVKSAYEKKLLSETGASGIYIIDTDEIAVPSVMTKKQGRTQHIDSDIFHKAALFRMKVEQYKQLINSKEYREKMAKKGITVQDFEVKGKVIEISDRDIDPVTGEPDKRIEDLFRAKMLVNDDNLGKAA